MLPWAPGTAAGGSCGEGAQGQRAIIHPEHSQSQPQTPNPAPTQPAQTSQPWGSSPLPSGSLPTSCDAALRGQLFHCPSMSVSPLHGKGRRAPPILVNAGPQSSTSIRVRTRALHNTHVTAPLQVPLFTSTCSLQFLPLSTLTVRVNLQQKCHMKPPRSCRPHAWRKGQARCPTVSHLVPSIPQGPTGLTQYSTEA